MQSERIAQAIKRLMPKYNCGPVLAKNLHKYGEEWYTARVPVYSGDCTPHKDGIVLNEDGEALLIPWDRMMELARYYADENLRRAQTRNSE